MDDGALPILTVGDLKSELSRWADETPVTSVRRSMNRSSGSIPIGPPRTYSFSRSMNFLKHRQRCCPARRSVEGLALARRSARTETRHGKCQRGHRKGLHA
jgi:hypothetical protein